jgi:hypothetical protein
MDQSVTLSFLDHLQGRSSILALEKEKNYFVREFSQAQEDLQRKREKEEQAKKEKEQAKKGKRLVENVRSSSIPSKGKGKAKDKAQLVCRFRSPP